MRTIRSWGDLERYGVVLLTGESCGLSYRLLCDVTARGKRVLEKCLGVPSLGLSESWNRGRADDPHVGSVLLAPELLVPVGVFALLEAGCREAYLVQGTLFGLEAGDPPDAIEDVKRVSGIDHARRFAYAGTAGDRNVHRMTGRVE